MTKRKGLNPLLINLKDGLSSHSKKDGSGAPVPGYPWCQGCLVCSEESNLHLYVDDSNSDTLSETLVIGMFGTNHQRFWGEKNIEARKELSLNEDRVFRFADIRGKNSPEAALGRAILSKLTESPLQFFARGLSAPFTKRDAADFPDPAARLRFYLTQFALMATSRIRVPTTLVLSGGPQADDPSFMPKLQIDLDEMSQRRELPKITLAEQSMRKCLLLQVSDLVAGCTRQLNLAGRNPAKLGIALDLNARLRRQNQRYTKRTWDWERYGGEPKKT